MCFLLTVARTPFACGSARPPTGGHCPGVTATYHGAKTRQVGFCGTGVFPWGPSSPADRSQPDRETPHSRPPDPPRHVRPRPKATGCPRPGATAFRPLDLGKCLTL